VAGDAIRGEAAVDGRSGSCTVMLVELVGRAGGKNSLDSKGGVHGEMIQGGAAGHNWAWSRQRIGLPAFMLKEHADGLAIT